MLTLSRTDLEPVITMEKVLTAVHRALLSLDEKSSITSQSGALSLPNGGECHVKGGHIIGSDWFAFKLATGSFPGAPNTGFTVVLTVADGTLAALIDDGGWLTEMRTAAAGALATDAMARSDCSRVAVLGTGVQARYQLEALRCVRPIAHLAVWGRTTERARQFVEDFGGSAVATAAEAARSADIIVTTTSATSPVLRGAWLRPGVHVTAIGADMPGKRELDDEVLNRAQVIACDDIATSRQVGELQNRPGQAARAVQLPSILNGRVSGRRTDDDITVADLCGLGVEDAAVADLVMAEFLPASLK